MFLTVSQAVDFLKGEKIIALPTETVYGLACLYNSKKAIEALYELKGRPSNKAMTINLAQSKEITTFLAKDIPGLSTLIEAFWPGPLTVVVPIKKDIVLPEMCGGKNLCGFRVPDHPLTLSVLKEVGPIVLPSANMSGEPPATSAREVCAIFGEHFPVLDGGESLLKIASTVLIFQEDRWWIARSGVITKQSLAMLLDYEPQQLGDLLCQT